MLYLDAKPHHDIGLDTECDEQEVAVYSASCTAAAAIELKLKC